MAMGAAFLRLSRYPPQCHTFVVQAVAGSSPVAHPPRTPGRVG
jgi:hypothetical protein